MATRAITNILRKSQALSLSSQRTPGMIQTRNMQLTTESGAVPKKPQTMSFGVIKVVLLSIPFIYVGAVMSREGAAWLEENEIFSPEDDD